MQLNQIKPRIKYKPKKRIGRGGKRGTFSGRGTKGQKARAGHKMRPELRDIIKKIPKKRGYRFKSFRKKAAIVNLKEIDRKFKDGEIITAQKLFEAGLVGKVKGRIPKIKILGKGELKKNLSFKDIKMSRAVKEKIKSK